MSADKSQAPEHQKADPKDSENKEHQKADPKDSEKKDAAAAAAAAVPSVDLNKFVYVVYAVRLDGGCLKKSDIDIVGVFDTKHKADKAQNMTEKEMRRSLDDDDDPRCNYVSVREFVLNKRKDLYF